MEHRSSFSPSPGPSAPSGYSTLLSSSSSLANDKAGGLRFAMNPEEDDAEAPETVDIVPWRMRERMKTMDVAMVLCLNIGTDPPDVVKSSPCARKECWVDPVSMTAQKALETIGKTLQSQYERWQPRAHYKQCLDPTVEDTKQLCVSLRRHAKHDRVLFHYNGHGVPRPTPNGEIWVFNKSYTQYIPLLVYDLQSWVGTPSIYVFDCSAAGILLSHFNTPLSPSSAATGDSNGSFNASSSSGEAIVLAACGANEILPMNPDLCADVFTSCLTTPITVALRWFITQNELSMSHLDVSLIERIPGKLTDRRTPLGELNWIFTAITDTIAWNVLPRELFQKLFRQDLLVASLFRNFLLAERIMKSEGCSPCSLPVLPPTNHHALWRSWDLAAETCLNQLYTITNPYPNTNMSFQPSRFFAEQLTAFEVWLQFGSSSKPPPQQLPMVLQVLLSQVHRLRALVLLKKFLDLGPWAVNLALSVGIFPYVLKLLQSPASELRQVLVFIWTKVLALDPSCQVDLVKADGHSYFISHLAAGVENQNSQQLGMPQHGMLGMPSDQKIMGAFVLSVICNNCPQGQKGCLSQHLHKICCHLLNDGHEDVRKWVLLCMAKLWDNYEDAKSVVIDDRVPRHVSMRLRDDRPEVRAAAAFAIGTLIGMEVDTAALSKHADEQQIAEHVRQRGHCDIVIATELLWGCQDISPLVRRESVLALANVILHTYHQPHFEYVAKHFKNHSVHKRSSFTGQTPTRSMSIDPNASGRPSMESGLNGDGAIERNFSVADIPVDSELIALIGEDAKYYVQIWNALKEIQSRDPFPKVVNAVKSIVSQINTIILESEQETLRRQSHLNNTNGSNNADHANHSLDDTVASTKPSANPMQRENSVPDLPTFAYAQNRGGGAMESSDYGQLAPAPASTSGIRPTQSFGNFRMYQEDYRRSNGNENGPAHLKHAGSANMLGHTAQGRLNGDESDVYGEGQYGMASDIRRGERRAPPKQKIRYGRQDNFPANLQSTFYDRAAAKFNEPMLEPFSEDEDPLSEKGAIKMERARRYERIRLAADKLAPGFSTPETDPLPNSYEAGSYTSSLPPTSLSGMPPLAPYSSSLNYGSSHRVGVHGDRDEVKNFTLSLRQRAVLNNDSEMTSLLLFHPYETLLVVADDKDKISLYNFEQSEKKLMTFGNKNPTG